MNMLDNLKIIWRGGTAPTVYQRDHSATMSENGRRSILHALASGPKTSGELIEITGIPQTTVYQYFKSLIQTGKVHSGNGPGKYYGLINHVLPCKINHTQAYVKKVYDYLEIPRELKEIETEFNDRTKGAVGYYLKVLQGYYGLKPRVILAKHYYAQIGETT